MSTHPLWRPFELADLDEVATLIITPQPDHPVAVVAPDPAWSDDFAALDRRVRGLLGDQVLGLAHVGSTSVPGLAAKPVVDADLTVPDPGDEAAYAPALLAGGFTFRLREPDWDEHRLFTVADRSVNLHVWGPASREPRRHLAFRDWLRTHPEDRDAYAELKQSLAARGFEQVMDYNNHKAAFIYDLYEKIFSADPHHEHDPQPRTP